MSRLLIIGPVFPFRGGIAQHTTTLCRRLVAAGHETLVVSFSRLYPTFLFPGESDRDLKQEDAKEPNAEYLIDSLNPITWYSSVRRIREFAPDAVIIAWWTFFLGPCLGTIARAIRHSSIPVIFFCHNVLDHEAAWWKKAVSSWALRGATGYAVHTRSEEEKLLSRFPQSPIVVHAHPIYDRFPTTVPILERRATRELLFFGLVRPYKGLDTLIHAFAKVRRFDVMLTVAGEFWEDFERYRVLASQLGVADRIDFQPRYHTDEEVGALFTRADVVVLPYRNATGTGVIPVAYHYTKPVIATRVGGLPDVVLEGITGILVEPEQPELLARAIEHACDFDWPALEEGIKNMGERMSWESLVATVTRLAQELASVP